MKSNYIKRLIFKDWLPLIVVFLTVASLSFVINLSNLELYYESTKLSIVSLTIPFTILAFIMPLFVYNYKFSLRSSDTFYQLPFQEKEMRNLRIIAGIIAIGVSLIICFLLGFIFFTIRFYASPVTKTFVAENYIYDEITKEYTVIEHTVTLVRSSYHPGMFWLLLPASLVGVAIEYFISCFLVSLTNKPFTAILFNGSIQLFLLGFLPSIILMANHFYSAQEKEIVTEVFDSFTYCETYALMFSPGLAFTSGITTYICDSFVFNGSFEAEALKGIRGFTFASTISLTLLIGALVAFLILYMKDPSGEHSGNYGLNKPKYNTLIYLSAIPLFFLFVALDNILSFYIIVNAIIVAGYYFLNTMFLGTFKIKKYHYIILGSMAVLFFFSYFL